MRLKEAYKLNRKHTISKNISEFGATPDNPDNSDAFAKAVVWLNEQANPACLIFEAGIYSYSVSPNWAVNHATITNCGVVRLRYTGTGNAFIVDGGTGAYIWDMRVGRFLIEAPTTAGHGVYWTGTHHSIGDFNVRGAGATKAGLYIGYSVVSEFKITVSVNEPTGWYTNAKPKHGVYMETVGGGPPSWCNFVNPILEGTEIGCEIKNGFGNQFNNGTMEGCTDGGLLIGSSSCLFNKVNGTDFEVNTNYDIDCDGLGNEFHNIDTEDLVHFRSNARVNKVFGGAHKSITLDSGGTGNSIIGVTIDKFATLAGTITDNATDTRITDVYDAGTNQWRNGRLVSLTTYDAQPARAAESNLHGGLLALATAQPLDSGPTNIVVTKGIGKILIVVNAGSDISGSITVTGTTINRDTGVQSGSDIDTITVDALTTDSSTTDANGNTVHGFAGAYITSKWFQNAVTLSTTDLTLTDVDVYHVSFEQFNDTPYYKLKTLDANIFTTNTAAEFDCYLYSLVVSGDKCTIVNEADVHVGSGGITALANQYERLRRGGINKIMNGNTDGIWIDAHYSNSPAWVEDATIKVWAET